MAHKWYAIQTYSGSELTVKRALLKLAEMADEKNCRSFGNSTEDLIEVKRVKKSNYRKTFISKYALQKLI